MRRRQAIGRTCQLEIVVGRNNESDEGLLRVTSGRSENQEMSQIPRKPAGPGPGDPLLAKQKHHHRRAFEFISKALKIDEENEGIFVHYFYHCLFCKVIDCEGVPKYF